MLGTYEVPQLDGAGNAVLDAFGNAIEDGSIDDLQRPELREVMPRDQSFFGRSFDPDVHLGNASQGLAVSVFHGNVLDHTLGTTSVGYDVSAYGAVGEITGEIKAPLRASR